MRNFQLVGLDAQPFEALFDLPDPALHARGIRRVRADADVGYPCRVALEDARAGDELLLLSYPHQPAASPYRASGPIFVRKGSRPRQLPPGEVPPYVTRRLMSLRAYDADDLIVDAEVVEGENVAGRLQALFANPAVRYVQLHNAKRGCFSCTARPV